MAISDRAKVEYEAGQNEQAWEDMTDSGDHLVFSSTFSPWSMKAGFEATVAPFGVITGCKIIPAVSGTNDLVDVQAGTLYMPGTAGADGNTGITTMAATTDLSISRATPSDTHIIVSVTVNASGAFAAVAGTDGTAFSTTRGAAGGPPLIPVDSVEIGQIRFDSNSSAAVAESEILQIVGNTQERYDFPAWTESASSGEATFNSELPLIHTGGVAKKVGVKGFTPIFAELPRAFDFVPADQQHSTGSRQVYNDTLGTRSSSLGQGSFSFLAIDGVTDSYIALKNETLWHRFYQDRNKAPYILTNGKIGISRSYPVDDHVEVSVTLSAEEQSAEFAS